MSDWMMRKLAQVFKHDSSSCEDLLFSGWHLLRPARHTHIVPDCLGQPPPASTFQAEHLDDDLKTRAKIQASKDEASPNAQQPEKITDAVDKDDDLLRNQQQRISTCKMCIPTSASANLEEIRDFEQPKDDLEK